MVIEQDLQSIYTRVKPLLKMEDSSVLITGCAGFLGYYLTRFFLSYSSTIGIQRVVGVDNLLLGSPPWIDELTTLYPGRFEFLRSDIDKDFHKLEPYLKTTQFVIHAASIASPSFYRLYPLETIDANINGLRKLLEYFRVNGNLRGLLCFSSSEIYGNPDPQCVPTPESYTGSVVCNGPRACYDEAKRLCETLAWVYGTKYDLPVVVVRPFNNYGPGLSSKDKRLPADLADKVLTGCDMVLHSDGSPRRTFCYIADATAGYLSALNYGKYDVFNIGMDTPEMSVDQFAQLFLDVAKEKFGYRGRIIKKASEEVDYLTDNPSRRCPDITKAKRLLNFFPSVEPSVGVERYLEHLWSSKL